MADNTVIYKKCSKCDGDGELNLTGVQPPHEAYIETCPKCNGEGKVVWGKIIEEEV